MAKRQSIKPLNQDAATIRAAAAAEKARKRASKAALRASTQAEPTPAAQPQPDPAELAQAESARVEREQAEREAALAAQRVDFEALMPEDQTWEQYLAAQGFNPDGSVASTAKAGTDKPHYTGPMLALRERMKAGAYVKGANGNPHCADLLATMLSVIPRDHVVRALIRALDLPGNPYTALNPGQQSMNLRNKARHAMVAGLLTESKVAEAIEATKQ